MVVQAAGRVVKARRIIRFWVPLIVLGLALTFTGAVLTPTLNGLGVWGFLIAVAGLCGASREDPFR